MEAEFTRICLHDSFLVRKKVPGKQALNIWFVCFFKIRPIKMKPDNTEGICGITKSTIYAI